jgi:hypothetical protein
MQHKYLLLAVETSELEINMAQSSKQPTAELSIQ